MWKLQPPPSPKKGDPIFPSNPLLKVEVLSSPPFMKMWLEAQPPPCRNGWGLHTMQMLAGKRHSNLSPVRNLGRNSHHVNRTRRKHWVQTCLKKYQQLEFTLKKVYATNYIVYRSQTFVLELEFSSIPISRKVQKQLYMLRKVSKLDQQSERFESENFWFWM